MNCNIHKSSSIPSGQARQGTTYPLKSKNIVKTKVKTFSLLFNELLSLPVAPLGVECFLLSHSQSPSPSVSGLLEID